MGYCDYLKELLRPLRLYVLDEGYGAAELKQEGAALDRCGDTFEGLETESSLCTAEAYGLEAYEALLPYRPASETAEERRAAIMALLRIDDGSFTLAALNDTIRGCGMDAVVQEGEEAMTVEVLFPGVRGLPENLAELQKRTEQILPCHLKVVYCYQFITWQQLEAWFPTWEALEDKAMTWEELEVYEE